MPRQNHYPVVSVYGCDKCSFTYESPIRLTEPPIHHCPSPKSSKTREAKLVDGEPDVRTQEHEDRLRERRLGASRKEPER